MRMDPTSSPVRRDPCSGQVLAESCIGLALMVLVWILVVFTTYMGTNQIRTAMACRHAAWLKGSEGGTASTAQLDQWFFYDTGLSKVEYLNGLGVGDLFGTVSGDRKTYSDAGQAVMARVTYGVANTNSLNKFPFVLLKSQVPLMPRPMMDQALSVNTSCQWDEVGNTWTTWAEALKGIWNAIVSTVSSFF